MVEETKIIILAKERCEIDCWSTSTPHFVKKVHNKHLPYNIQLRTKYDALECCS